MTAPAPLTPADADLQDFPFMPLHVARLRDSDLAAEAHPEACWYAVLLWAAAWHQLPAGSLPSGEAVLARLCGLGRDLRTFRRHRADAMRGWVECADGRLYHPVVAEQVNAAWGEKLAYRERKAARKAIAEKAAEARWSKSESTPDADASPMHEASPEDASSIADAMPKGRGTGRGRGTGNIEDDGGSACARADVAEIAAEACRVAGIRHLEPGPIIRHQQLVQAWIGEGLDPEGHILPGIRDAVANASEPIGSLNYFDKPVRQYRARMEAHAHGHAPRNGTAAPANPIVRAVAARRADRVARSGADVELRDAAGGFA